MMTFFAIARNLAFTLLVFASASAHAASLPDKFPRTANYFLTPTVSQTQAEQLAQWDVVILGLEVQYTSPDAFSIMRTRNPDILLLAYVPSEEIPAVHLTLTDPNHPLAQLAAGVNDDWWLRDHAGNRTGYWPGSYMVDVAKGWNTYLPQFIHNHVMATGLWDGIFYDNVFRSVSWVNNGDIDLNRDGVIDSATTIDASWSAGMETLLAQSRLLEGDAKLIVGNGGDGSYFNFLNGRLIEEYPSSADGGWQGATDRYFDALIRGSRPSLTILNGKTDSGNQRAYRAMRFSLASTLLGDGFASFDKGIPEHFALWWYDEYETTLGLPITEAKNLGDGIWKRSFQYGVVFVNTNATARTIEAHDIVATFSGTQDPETNHGQIVRSFVLNGQDGILLFRRQIAPVGFSFTNGAFARVFDGTTGRYAQEFATYTPDIDGGATIAQVDLENDGSTERVRTVGPALIVADSQGKELRRWYPYGKKFRPGIHFLAADLNRDGTKEIITGTGRGGAPHVRLFDGFGKPLSPGFFAGPKKSRSGVNIGVGNISGDGRPEIVTAPAQGEPRVKIFSQSGKLLRTFLAYNAQFRGGLSVAVGNVAGDNRQDIITAPGPGGGPHVRIFSAQGKPVSPGFFAYAKSYRGGIGVNTVDFNDDGQDDIIVSASIPY